jgi:hypothetical protein
MKSVFSSVRAEMFSGGQLEKEFRVVRESVKRILGTVKSADAE